MAETGIPVLQDLGPGRAESTPAVSPEELATCKTCGQNASFQCAKCGKGMCHAHKRLWKGQTWCIDCQSAANKEATQCCLIL
mmetsp:Transcript_61403/g.179466  ORF Transcript_61403/g.179466 Transcript_61403/m.179466 type:complete len:82 (-) Transcript_61403:154-399(-)